MKGQRRNPLPWKERKALDEKKRFIAQWERQTESLAELCRRYDISRQTGYKWLERYEQEGEAGLEEHSRAPLNHPQAMPAKVREALIRLGLAPQVGLGPTTLQLTAESYPSVRPRLAEVDRTCSPDDPSAVRVQSFGASAP
jgi:putative transposase